MAYCEITRTTVAYTKPTLNALIFFFAKAAPLTARCILRIVVAHAYEEGNIRCNSLAVCMIKKFLTDNVSLEHENRGSLIHAS